MEEREIPARKACNLCGRMLSLDEFNRDKSKADGLQSKCRGCQAAMARRYAVTPAGDACEQRAADVRVRRQNADPDYTDRRRELVRKSCARPEYRKKLRAHAHTDAGLIQKRAHGMLERAVKARKVVKPDACEACGRDPGHDHAGRSLLRGYHHKGYGYPLDVQWLCARCLNRLNAGREPVTGEEIPG